MRSTTPNLPLGPMASFTRRSFKLFPERAGGKKCTDGESKIFSSPPSTTDRYERSLEDAPAEANEASLMRAYRWRIRTGRRIPQLISPVKERG